MGAIRPFAFNYRFERLNPFMGFLRIEVYIICHWLLALDLLFSKITAMLNIVPEVGNYTLF